LTVTAFETPIGCILCSFCRVWLNLIYLLVIGGWAMRRLAPFVIIFLSAVCGHQASAQDITGSYLIQGRNPNGSAYTGTVIIRPAGDRYHVFWFIGASETYNGSGGWEGDSLVIDWGQQYPVIYKLGSDGVLYGTWDNGRATENLIPSR
jgi:hypothetical protein